MATEIKGLNYFPVDIHFFQSDKIAVIEADYGLKALAVVFKLLCRIYSEGFYMVWDERACKLFRLNACAECSAQELRAIVEALVREGFFSAECFDRYGVLTSKGIQRRFFEAASRRKRLEIERRELLLVEPAGATKREPAQEEESSPEKGKNEAHDGEMPASRQITAEAAEAGKAVEAAGVADVADVADVAKAAELAETAKVAKVAKAARVSAKERAAALAKAAAKALTKAGAQASAEPTAKACPNPSIQARTETAAKAAEETPPEAPAQATRHAGEEKAERTKQAPFLLPPKPKHSVDISTENVRISGQRKEKDKREKKSNTFSTSTSSASPASPRAGQCLNEARTETCPLPAATAPLPIGEAGVGCANPTGTSRDPGAMGASGIFTDVPGNIPGNVTGKVQTKVQAKVQAKVPGNVTGNISTHIPTEVPSSTSGTLAHAGATSTDALDANAAPPSRALAPTTSAAPASFAARCHSWRDALLSDEDWRASIVRISGKGISVLPLLPEAMSLFEDHITTIGERHTLRAPSDYARRFVCWWRCLDFKTPDAITRPGVGCRSQAFPAMPAASPLPGRTPSSPDASFSPPPSAYVPTARPASETGIAPGLPPCTAPAPNDCAGSATNHRRPSATEGSPSFPAPATDGYSFSATAPGGRPASRAEQALQTSATAAGIALQLIGLP